MSRRVNFQLNDEQLAEIEQAINHTRRAKKPHGYPDSRLRSIAVVVMKDATQNLATAHRTARCSTCWRNGNLLVNPLMWARRIEKGDVLAHDPAQMRLIEDRTLSLTEVRLS